jgi:hypothetical protein
MALLGIVPRVKPRRGYVSDFRGHPARLKPLFRPRRRQPPSVWRRSRGQPRPDQRLMAAHYCFYQELMVVTGRDMRS